MPVKKGPDEGSVYRGRWAKRKPPRKVTSREAAKASEALRGDASSTELSAAGKALSERRNSLLSKKSRSEIASYAASCYWDAMSEKERRIEVKRRAMVRKKRRRDALRKRIQEGRERD